MFPPEVQNFADDARRERLEEIFWDSHRDFVPIREAFLQTRGKPPQPGPLSKLVAGGHHHALDLYLLIHASTATAPKHQLAMNPDWWLPLVARPDQSARNARRALYRSIETLEWLELAKPVTRLGIPVIELLDEDGWGDLYTHPFTAGDRYFRLPHDYWREALDRRLSLPAKAVLLITRSLKPEGFTLPLANAKPWYGISADTFRRGMRELVRAGLARYQSNVVDAPKAPHASAIRRTYKLAGVMSRDAAAAPSVGTPEDVPF